MKNIRFTKVVRKNDRIYLKYHSIYVINLYLKRLSDTPTKSLKELLKIIFRKVSEIIQIHKKSLMLLAKLRV